MPNRDSRCLNASNTRAAKQPRLEETPTEIALDVSKVSKKVLLYAAVVCSGTSCEEVANESRESKRKGAADKIGYIRPSVGEGELWAIEEWLAKLEV